MSFSECTERVPGLYACGTFDTIIFITHTVPLIVMRSCMKHILYGWQSGGQLLLFSHNATCTIKMHMWMCVFCINFTYEPGPHAPVAFTDV